MTHEEKLAWKVHVTRLLNEVVTNRETAVLRQPMIILDDILHQVARRASELNDPELNGLMARLALYAVSDPYDEAYDETVTERLITESLKVQERRSGQHRLQGFIKDRSVYLDGKRLDPRVSQYLINHSPDGFNWGYCGSGPAQLALSVVLALTGKSAGYQEFKNTVIAGIPQGKDFDISFKL